MPKLHEMLESKYLKKEDVGDGVLATIAEVKKVNIAVEGADPEYKWAMSFEEFGKPMVMNSTNLQLSAKAMDSDDTDDWLGKKIVLYTDPNVSFGGKIVGGIRVRKPKVKTQTAPQKPRQSTPFDDLEEEGIPF